MNRRAPAAFSPRAVLALVLLGTAVFVALLWMIGAGLNSGEANDGGGHAGGKGLNGHAAFAGYLERRGHRVRLSRSAAALDDPGLLVLTPPHHADGADLERIVSARRYLGPTLVILPKWLAGPAPDAIPGARKGWVFLAGTASPQWRGFLDDISVDIAPAASKGAWRADGLRSALPDDSAVQTGGGERLVPLAETADGKTLAGWIADGGMHPALEDMALSRPGSYGEDEDLYPLAVVFEPDLIDNWGMARRESASWADALVRALGEGSAPDVIFDLTLNGHARSANLLTLAFTPPYLAATLCLMIAALVVGWRAFLRFGPPVAEERAIAFGKTALVANAAALVQRSGRLHLVTAPYADAVRERLARILALPRLADTAKTEAAIDRALAARRPGAQPFSALAARLRNARGRKDILDAAGALHALERTVNR